jgi:hypothetical protein
MICDKHFYVNTSLEAKFCPTGREELKIRDIEDQEILLIRSKALEMFGPIKGEAGETGVSAIDYPRNFNVLTGEKVELETTSRAMKR